MINQYFIIDCNQNEMICIINANDKKSALEKFKLYHCLYEDVYKIVKDNEDGYKLISSYGSYFIAQKCTIHHDYAIG